MLMNLLSGSGRLSVGPIAPGLFNNLSTERVSTTEPGILVVYVDNQTMGKDVWFDNVQVLHYNTRVMEENHYYPFGLTTSVSAMGTTPQPLKYQTKELERSFGIESYDFHARQYDPQLGRFNSMDPLADKFASMSPYTGMGNNPINAIDPDGKEVQMTFIRPAQRLEIIDMDHYKLGLPTIYVTAAEYKAGGIRDESGKLTTNQILVINDVFSGGRSTNGKVERDPQEPEQRAIPEGQYDLVDNDADTRHKGWYRVDKQDSKPYNDTDEATGRDGFRFHMGTLSYGCVTCDQSKYDRSSEWSVVQKIFNNTSTTTVKEQRGRQGYNPFAWLTRYGTLKVIGPDNIPPKKDDTKNKN